MKHALHDHADRRLAAGPGRHLRADLTPTRRRSRATAAVAALVAAAVVACGPLPRPFAREAPNPLVEEGRAMGVEVRRVAGTTGPMSRLLGEAVAKALQARDIPARVGTLSSGRFVLEGRAERNRSRPDLPYVVLLHWRLMDRGGNEHGVFTQGIEGARFEWDYGSPRIIEAVGAATAARVAPLALGDRYAGVEPSPERRGIWVGAVAGAPGDGNEALARGMRLALGGAGHPVTADRDRGRYRLSATVRVGPPEGRRQNIEIVWIVADGDGKELGRARQANAVPAGSLDGAWGQTAALAATAAVDGVAGIIAAAEQPEVPGRRTAPLRRAPATAPDSPLPAPTVPPSRSLPREPGRALPPPG